MNMLHRLIAIATVFVLIFGSAPTSLAVTDDGTSTDSTAEDTTNDDSTNDGTDSDDSTNDDTSDDSDDTDESGNSETTEESEEEAEKRSKAEQFCRRTRSAKKKAQCIQKEIDNMSARQRPHARGFSNARASDRARGVIDRNRQRISDKRDEHKAKNVVRKTKRDLKKFNRRARRHLSKDERKEIISSFRSEIRDTFKACRQLDTREEKVQCLRDARKDIRSRLKEKLDAAREEGSDEDTEDDTSDTDSDTAE